MDARTQLNTNVSCIQSVLWRMGFVVFWPDYYRRAWHIGTFSVDRCILAWSIASKTKIEAAKEKPYIVCHTTFGWKGARRTAHTSFTFKRSEIIYFIASYSWIWKCCMPKSVNPFSRMPSIAFPVAACACCRLFYTTRHSRMAHNNQPVSHSALTIVTHKI